MAYPSDLVRTKNWGTEKLTDADLEGQLDLIIDWIMAAFNSSTGHAHEGTSNKSPKISAANLVAGAYPCSAVGNLVSMLPYIYPVGSIYINANVATNPGTLLGFGTWVAFGAGKVMVGLDGADADFDTAEEVGGAKTHTLTEAEMPSHNHSVVGYSTGGGGGPEISSGQSATPVSLIVGDAGSDGAHNNLQPYIVVYMWKRTA